MNRLTSAQNTGTDCSAVVLQGRKKFWGNTYTYDAWGNLTNKTKIPSACGGELLSAPALTNNQLSGYGYDAAGNMTTDPTDNVTSTYDAENRIATANTPQGVFTYTYDSDGNRVEKSGGGSGTLYWYMAPGIVAESDPAGNLKSEYVFFNGERGCPQGLRLIDPRANCRNVPTSLVDGDGHSMGTLNNEGFEGFEFAWSKLSSGPSTPSSKEENKCGVLCKVANIFRYGDRHWRTTDEIISGEKQYLQDKGAVILDHNTGKVVKYSDATNAQIDDAYKSLRNMEMLNQIRDALGMPPIVPPMLGANGTQVTSKTLWQENKTRIDVENPNPGQRPGQIHYQDGTGKYIYDVGTGRFQGLSQTQNDNLLSKPEVQAAIQKGLRYLGVGQ